MELTGLMYENLYNILKDDLSNMTASFIALEKP